MDTVFAIAVSTIVENTTREQQRELGLALLVNEIGSDLPVIEFDIEADR